MNVALDLGHCLLLFNFCGEVILIVLHEAFQKQENV